jgi:hypothetical protein
MYSIFAEYDIRVGFFSASQTSREQDEDVAPSFKDNNQDLPSKGAQRYLDSFPDKVERIMYLIRAQDYKTSKCLTDSHLYHCDAITIRSSKAFSLEKTLEGRRKSRHQPVDGGRIFDNHPGMARAPKAVRDHCKRMIHDISELLGLQGYLSENNLDTYKIPETKEQEAKRVQGKKVKMDLGAGLKSRWTREIMRIQLNFG